MQRLYTAESVSFGHPDKVADQISDALLDACLSQDPDSRVAIETLVTRGFILVAGEVTTHSMFDLNQVVRNTVKQIGYTQPHLGFDAESCAVLQSIQRQSPNIAMGVDTGGAGDQGIMYGYATDETSAFMPFPIQICHQLMQRLKWVHHQHPELQLGPDAKTQASVIYEQGVPQYLKTLVFSCQHSSETSNEEVYERLQHYVIQPVIERNAHYCKEPIHFLINPTGRFEIGGPAADTGLTGRKIIVDTYGGFCPHGGGAFSGKDPTKVDRSAAYMARHIAKCIVAFGLAKRAQISLAYAIGVEQPVAIDIETFNTETIAIQEIERLIRRGYNLSPQGIIQHLNLKQTRYLPTAQNGHFGHEEFPWENPGLSHDIFVHYANQRAA